MKIPTYEKQFTTPQPFNTVQAVPDYSDAIKTAAVGQVVTSGMQAAGQILSVYDQVKRKGLQMDAEEALRSVSDEVAEYINAKDYVTFEWEGNETNRALTDDAEELLKYKLESNYRLLSEKIKSPGLKKEFTQYWQRMSSEVEGVLGEVNRKRRTESVEFITGKAMAKAELEGDLEEIYSIINMRIEAGLIRPEQAGDELAASKTRMAVTMIKDELQKLSYEQGLKALAGVRAAGELPEKETKAIESWYKETWGLAKAAEKEQREALKLEVNSEFVDRFYSGRLTKADVMNEKRLDNLPGEKERWFNKLEQRAKAGLENKGDPNKQTDVNVYAQTIEVVSDPNLSPAEKKSIILSRAGADENGNPQLNDTDTKSLLNRVESSDISKTTGINILKNAFDRRITGARRASQKETLTQEKNSAILQFEQIMQSGKYNAQEAEQVAKNILEPFMAKSFTENIVSMGGFMDTWGMNPAEELQAAIQNDRLLGRIDEYAEQLEQLYTGQQREFTAKTKLGISNIGYQSNGQMLIEGSDGNAYRIIIENKDEALQKYNRANKAWEFMNE